MTATPYRLDDLGHERVLTVGDRRYRTYYSERVIRMLIERKGLERAPLYFPFKETRGRHFLDRLFAYLGTRSARGAHGPGGLSVLEVGCSFGHITEYLAEQPLVAVIRSFDVDRAFVDITRAKVEDLGLLRVRQVLHLDDEETTRLPFDEGAFDVVLAIGVIEHLPPGDRRPYVDEYYRVLAPGGHIAILDTPNRAFPLETHSVGLPGVQWLPPKLAYRYTQALGPRRLRGVDLPTFDRHGAWRNAWFRECLPSTGMDSLVDVTEEAGYGWRFFKDTSRSGLRKAAIRLLTVPCAALAALGRPPSRALPYFNLVFRKRAAGARGGRAFG